MAVTDSKSVSQSNNTPGQLSYHQVFKPTRCGETQMFVHGIQPWTVPLNRS